MHAKDGNDPMKDQRPRTKKDKYTRQVRQANTIDGQKLAKDLSPCDSKHGPLRGFLARGPNLESECMSIWQAKEHGVPR